MSNIEIQTCIGWRGPRLANYEIPEGGIRRRWHCLDCHQKGPPEVDGAVVRRQIQQHQCESESA